MMSMRISSCMIMGEAMLTVYALCIAIKRAAMLPVYFIVTPQLWTSVKLSSSTYQGLIAVYRSSKNHVDESLDPGHLLHHGILGLRLRPKARETRRF